MSEPLDETPRLNFPKVARVRTTGEFKTIYERRCKASDGTLLVFVASNSLGKTRLGLSVSRKFGNAVMRNRLKRLVREAFRLSRDELPAGIDLVVIPQGPLRSGIEIYRESLVRLARKLHRRLMAAANEPAPPGQAKPIGEETVP